MYSNFNKNNRFDGNRGNSSAIKSVKFRDNVKDIVLKYPKSILTAGDSHDYDRNLVHSEGIWHQIVILDKENCNRNEIASALSKAVNGKFFVPIAYQVGVTADVFYVFDQGTAIEELLKKDLIVEVDDDRDLRLTVKLDVGTYEKGQINPLAKIEDALKSRLKEMQNFKLDLSNFKICEEFFDMKFWIGIEENFDVLCEILAKIMSRENCRKIRGKIKEIDLSGNELRSLKALEKLDDFTGVEWINLKENLIENPEEIKSLENFKLKHLLLAENPLASDPKNLHEILTSTLPKLIHCDIQRVLPEPPPKRIKLNDAESTPNSEGGNIVTVTDIDEEFKAKFEDHQCIKDVWSKIYIEHKGKVESEKILDEMFEQFFNDTLCFPCYYKTGENEDSFYLFDNFDAIKILVRNNLEIKIRDQVISFRLHLRCADHVEGQPKYSDDIPKLILTRSRDQKVNLSNFQKDPKLKNLIVKMSTDVGLKYVTSWIAQLSNKNQYIEIDLSGNGIKCLSTFAWLDKFTNLKVLNLADNRINSLNGLSKNQKIVVLSFDRNPICTKYFHLPYLYVSTMMDLYGNLEYLDGHKINKDFKIVTLKNFHCDPAAFNAVENFVEFFIKNFDGQRKILEKVYLPNTIYMERYGKGAPKMILGGPSIMSHLIAIPPTSHDLTNTSFDVPQFNPRNFQIVINGILKINHQPYTYTRTLMLMTRGKRAMGTLSNTFYFYIANEIFHFDDIRDAIFRSRALKSKPASLEDIEKAYDGLFTKSEEMMAKISLLQQITKLKVKWCKRFLEDANGNVNDALEFFNNFYQKKILKPEDFEGLKGQ